MTKIDAIGQRVQDAYADASRAERLHVAGRLRSCPMDAVDAVTPREGRVLDFGCGHGAVTLYLALGAPGREMHGVDVDRDKLVHARAAAARAGASIAYDDADLDYRPAGEWDAITIVDVLYLLPEAIAMDVLDHAAACLTPGGVLVVKEMDTRPRRKYWFAVAQEVLATKVLRITEGTTLHIIPPAVIGERLARAGLEVEQRSVHRGRLHPHHLVIATRRSH